MLAASILQRNCTVALTPVRLGHSIPHCLPSLPNKWFQWNAVKYARRSDGELGYAALTPFVFTGGQNWGDVIWQTNDNGGEKWGGCFETHPQPGRRFIPPCLLELVPGPPLSLSALGNVWKSSRPLCLHLSPSPRLRSCDLQDY